MSLKCPCCQSEEFYLCVDFTYSFKIKNIKEGMVNPLAPEELAPESKYLICDNCEFSGWIEDYFEERSNRQ